MVARFGSWLRCSQPLLLVVLRFSPSLPLRLPQPPLSDLLFLLVLKVESWCGDGERLEKMKAGCFSPFLGCADLRLPNLGSSSSCRLLSSPAFVPILGFSRAVVSEDSSWAGLEAGHIPHWAQHRRAHEQTAYNENVS